MKKKKLTKPIFLLLLVLGALWWSGCGNTDDNGPCPEEDWVYDIRSLNHEYDTLFPYDGTQKTLTYLYSNDTIEGDTLVFELYKTDTMEITGNSWSGGGGGCTVFADEVNSLYYRLLDKESYGFEFLIQRTRRGQHLELIDRNSYNASFMEYPSWVYSYEIHDRDINQRQRQTLVISDVKYHNVVFVSKSTLYTCDKDSFEQIEFLYNTVYGFIQLTNLCKTETFKLINL